MLFFQLQLGSLDPLIIGVCCRHDGMFSYFTCIAACMLELLVKFFFLDYIYVLAFVIGPSVGYQILVMLYVLSTCISYVIRTPNLCTHGFFF